MLIKTKHKAEENNKKEKNHSKAFNDYGQVNKWAWAFEIKQKNDESVVWSSLHMQ